MTTYLLHLITISAFVLGLDFSIALAQPVSTARPDVPPLPPNIEVPAGNSVFLKGHAEGTQNFICLPAGSGVAWRFFAPQATLFLEHGRGIDWQVTTHFLSANPAENGVARPTWQHSFDTSRVWGRAIASSNDPNFVAPGAIPWLLLEVVGRARGPAGTAFLSQASYIHRVNTTGGVAPSTGCSQTAEIGTFALVPYAADYFFYRADRR
jgi:hypothetical protein